MRLLGRAEDRDEPEPDHVAGILHACVLTAKAVHACSPRGYGRWTPADGVLWLHMISPRTGPMSGLQSGLPVTCPTSCSKYPTDLKTRRRHSTCNGLLVALRGVNMNPGQNPADIRVDPCVAGFRILVASRRRRSCSAGRGRPAKRQRPAERPATSCRIVSPARRPDRRLRRQSSDQSQSGKLRCRRRQFRVATPGTCTPRRQIANVRRSWRHNDALEKVHRYPAPWMPQDEIQQLREESGTDCAIRRGPRSGTRTSDFCTKNSRA